MARRADFRAVPLATPAKQSFGDKGVTKLELGHEENKDRDRLVTHTLRKEGWKVVRIWECDLKP